MIEVYFDLDNTLVDIEPLWFAVFVKPLAKRLGMTEREVQTAGEAIWHEGDTYSPFKHLQRLGVASEVSALKIMRRFIDVVKAGETTFHDVRDFFARHRDLGHVFHVITFGQEEYQLMKLDGLGVPTDTFTDIIVVDGWGIKGKLLQERWVANSRPRVIIEDSRRELASVKRNATDVCMVQIIRSQKIEKFNAAHHHITTLSQLDALLSA